METQISSAREQLLAIIGTRYRGLYGPASVLDKLVFGQPTKEASVAVLKDAFAFWTLPVPTTNLTMDDPASPTDERGAAIVTALKDLYDRGEMKSYCCTCFEGATAEKAAENVYDLLGSIEEKFGVDGRIVMLASLLESNHVPHTDVTHQYDPWDAENEMPRLIAENLDLFAELFTLWKRRTNPIDLAYWIGHIPCDEKVRSAMITYSFAFMDRNRSPFRGGGLFDMMSSGLGSLVAEAMIRGAMMIPIES